MPGLDHRPCPSALVVSAPASAARCSYLSPLLPRGGLPVSHSGACPRLDGPWTCAGHCLPVGGRVPAGSSCPGRSVLLRRRPAACGRGRRLRLPPDGLPPAEAAPPVATATPPGPLCVRAPLAGRGSRLRLPAQPPCSEGAAGAADAARPSYAMACVGAEVPPTVSRAVWRPSSPACLPPTERARLSSLAIDAACLSASRPSSTGTPARQKRPSSTARRWPPCSPASFSRRPSLTPGPTQPPVVPRSTGPGSRPHPRSGGS